MFLPFSSASFGVGRTQERVLAVLELVLKVLTQSPEKLGKQLRLGNEGNVDPHTGISTAYFQISLKASSFLSCLWEPIHSLGQTKGLANT